MPSACWRMCARMSVLLRPSIAVERKQRQNWCGHDRVSRPPRKKSADLGSSRCEVDIKRVYDAVIRPGNLSNAGLILPTCRLFRLSFYRLDRDRIRSSTTVFYRSEVPDGKRLSSYGFCGD